MIEIICIYTYRVSSIEYSARQKKSKFSYYNLAAMACCTELASVKVLSEKFCFCLMAAIVCRKHVYGRLPLSTPQNLGYQK